MNINFSKASVEDLQSIKKYIYADNKLAAKEVVEYIVKTIETVILNNTAIGKAGRILSTRELCLTKYPYIIVYQVKEQQLFIVRILHSSRKWE